MIVNKKLETGNLKISNFLNKKKKGFSGITHCLIALLLFEIIWIIPIFGFLVDPIKEQNWFIKAIYWSCLVGAALLPDLDNSISSAGYTLGFVGTLFHTFMVSTSSLIYSVCKTKKDQTKTQHRMFWHTPLSCALLYLYCMYACKQFPDVTVFEIIKTKTPLTFGQILNMGFVYLFVGCSFILFLSKFEFNLRKILKKFGKILSTILSIVFFVYLVLKARQDFIFNMCQAVCIGCLFHNIGDLFSKGSIPLFFPIPVKGQVWFKPRFPFQIETSGPANRILDIVLWIADATLLIIILGGGAWLKSMIKI